MLLRYNLMIILLSRFTSTFVDLLLFNYFLLFTFPVMHALMRLMALMALSSFGMKASQSLCRFNTRHKRFAFVLFMLFEIPRPQMNIYSIFKAALGHRYLSFIIVGYIII